MEFFKTFSGIEINVEWGCESGVPFVVEGNRVNPN